MDKYTDLIWIGNWHDAVRDEKLYKHDIKCVLSLTHARRPPMYPFTWTAHSPFPDNDEASPLQIVSAIFQLHHMVGERRLPTLVHCAAGHSRSTSVIAGYRLALEGKPLAETAAELRAIRPKCHMDGTLRRVMQRIDFERVGEWIRKTAS